MPDDIEPIKEPGKFKLKPNFKKFVPKIKFKVHYNKKILSRPPGGS